MKWKISTKLSVSFISILLLIALSTIISLAISKSVLITSGKLATKQYPSMEALNSMTTMLYEIRIVYDQYFLSKKKIHLDRIKENQKTYEESLNRYLSLSISAKEKEMISRFKPAVKEYFQKFDDAITFFKKYPDRLSGAMKQVAIADELMHKKVMPIIQEMQIYKKTETDDMVNKLQGDLKTSNKLTIFVGLIAIIIGIILAIVLGRSISRPVVALTKATNDISVGKFTVPINVKTKDEINDLALAIERMRKSLQKAMERLQKK